MAFFNPLTNINHYILGGPTQKPEGPIFILAFIKNVIVDPIVENNTGPATGNPQRTGDSDLPLGQVGQQVAQAGGVGNGGGQDPNTGFREPPAGSQSGTITTRNVPGTARPVDGLPGDIVLTTPPFVPEVNFGSLLTRIGQSAAVAPGDDFPSAPVGVSVDRNIREILAMVERLARLGRVAAFGHWLRNVSEYGEWDYKTRGPEYADFGNFNYGATGRAVGFDLETLLKGAGAVQIGSEWYSGVEP